MRKKIAAAVLAAAMACAVFTGCSDSPASSSLPSSSTPSNGSSTSNSSSTANSASSSENNSSSNNSSSPSSSSDSTTAESTATKLRIDSYDYYSTIDSNGHYHVFYTFIVTNTNRYKSFNYANLNFTVKSTSGAVLRTSQSFIPPVAPGDTITFGGEIIVDNGVPSTLSYKVSYPSYCMEKPTYPKQSALKISNTSRHDGSPYDNPFTTFTGEIENTSSRSLNVTIRIFYRVGDKLLAGESTYISQLKAGAISSFEVTAAREPSHYDSYVIIAAQALS